MPDDRQHRAVEGVVEHDRDVVRVGKLEEVILDPQDGIEILEVLVGRARARGPATSCEAGAERRLLEGGHDQEDVSEDEEELKTMKGLHQRL